MSNSIVKEYRDMGKLFQFIGGLMAMACLLEIAISPETVIRDIQRGPAPNLARFDDQLKHPKAHPKHRAKQRYD